MPEETREFVTLVQEIEDRNDHYHRPFGTTIIRGICLSPSGTGDSPVLD